MATLPGRALARLLPGRRPGAMLEEATGAGWTLFAYLMVIGIVDWWETPLERHSRKIRKLSKGLDWPTYQGHSELKDLEVDVLMASYRA